MAAQAMMEEMSAEGLASQLYAAAEERAQAAGRNFGEGADHDLRDMTLKAAVALLTISNPTERRSQIELAEQDIGRLIDMAIENAEGLAGYRSNLLGEQTYFPAKLRFCPCRPFC